MRVLISKRSEKRKRDRILIEIWEKESDKTEKQEEQYLDKGEKKKRFEKSKTYQIKQEICTQRDRQSGNNRLKKIQATKGQNIGIRKEMKQDTYI